MVKNLDFIIILIILLFGWIQHVLKHRYRHYIHDFELNINKVVKISILKGIGGGHLVFIFFF